jgi:hypothetical protein
MLFGSMTLAAAISTLVSATADAVQVSPLRTGRGRIAEITPANQIQCDRS